MRLKKIYIVYAILVVLGLVAIYTGITFTATFTKALTQPHLESATTRFDFLGFYMLSGTYGGICLACIIVFVIVTVLLFKKRKKN